MLWTAISAELMGMIPAVLISNHILTQGIGWEIGRYFFCGLIQHKFYSVETEIMAESLQPLFMCIDTSRNEYCIVLKLGLPILFVPYFITSFIMSTLGLWPEDCKHFLCDKFKFLRILYASAHHNTSRIMHLGLPDERLPVSFAKPQITAININIT